MTVIAAVTDGHTAWLGADSCGLDEGGLNWPSNDKVIGLLTEVGERVLLAFAGSSRLKGAMRDFLRLGPLTDDLDAWARDTARRITDVALEARPPITDETGEVEGYGFLATRGRLWRFAQDTAVTIARSGAVGSGGDIATGVLSACDALNTGISPEDMVTLALNITCAKQSDCALPITVAHT